MMEQSAYGANYWGFTNEEAILKRAAELTKPGVWVNETDLQAIADIWNLQIVVSHTTNTQVFKPSEYLDERTRTVGIAHLGERHYVPIVPLAFNWFEDQERIRAPTHSEAERISAWSAMTNTYTPAFLRDYEEFMNSHQGVIDTDVLKDYIRRKRGSRADQKKALELIEKR